MSKIEVKNLKEVLQKEDKEEFKAEPKISADGWFCNLVVNGDCLTYVVGNDRSKEFLVIDPSQEGLTFCFSLMNDLLEYRCLGVIDTHTHADHISAAGDLAEAWNVPLIMHALSPSSRVQLRVAKATSLPSQVSQVQLILTPGHTPDSLCVLWGPFLFTGDLVLFKDAGRDDLPGGDAAAHFDSLQKLKEIVSPEAIVCPGHDNRGGRLSSWGFQLRENSSLFQEREDYIQEAIAFEAPAPQLLKKALFENFK